jgi:hypothetical protein
MFQADLKTSIFFHRRFSREPAINHLRNLRKDWLPGGGGGEFLNDVAKKIKKIKKIKILLKPIKIQKIYKHKINPLKWRFGLKSIFNALNGVS